MDDKLQNKLFKKYPSIFQDRKKSIKESCMPWGISTGDGWFNLIDSICSSLKNIENNNKGIKIIAEQVKQKFGTLRFYYRIDGSPERAIEGVNQINRIHGQVDGIMMLAHFMSEKICEDCGNPATMQTRGYISNICDDCSNKRIVEHQKLMEKAKKEFKNKKKK